MTTTRSLTPEWSLPPGMDSLHVAALVDAMPDGVYITDTQRRILVWNSAAESITGWSRKRVVGSSCRDNILAHVDKDGRPLCGEECCPLQQAMVTGRSQSTPVLVYAQHRTGRRIPVEVSTAPLRDASGKVIGGIEIFRDATVTHNSLRAAALIQQHALDCRPSDDGPVAVAIRHIAVDVVGGDFLRVEQVNPHRYAAMVANVRGTGLPAALFTLQLRVLWDDLRELLPNPSAFLGRLNNRLRGLTGRDASFASACLVVADTATGQLVCATAGHPPPLLRRADGTFELLRAGGMALGVLAGATYEEQTCAFRVGDALLLYTQGATAVTDPQGQALGADGLARLCGELDGKALAKLEQIDRALLDYSHQHRLAVDLTLIALQRRQ